jgi:hypothetical protein
VLCIHQLDLIFDRVSKGRVSKIVQQADESNHRFSVADELSEFAGCEGARDGIIGGTYPQFPLTVTEIVDDGVHKLIDLTEHPYNVVNPSVRRINKNPVGQSKLPETIETLHCRSVENLQLCT